MHIIQTEVETRERQTIKPKSADDLTVSINMNEAQSNIQTNYDDKIKFLYFI